MAKINTFFLTKITLRKVLNFKTAYMIHLS